MVVGIDYTEEYTQISYAIQGMKTPETVSISFGEKKISNSLNGVKRER